MKEKLTQEAEEYLEAIYRLEEKKGFARTTELSSQLKVVPGSVTNTVEHLEKHGLIIHEPYKGVRLTDKGRKLALDVLRKHRLAERFLTDMLHLDWSKVHDEACKLEHVIEKNVLIPLDKALGHPKTCPHGNPIPLTSGEVIEEESEKLSSLNAGEEGVVVKVSEEKSDLLKYIATLGLVPNASIEVVEKSPLEDPMIVKVNGTNYTLGPQITSFIWVKKTPCQFLQNPDKSTDYEKNPPCGLFASCEECRKGRKEGLEEVGMRKANSVRMSNLKEHETGKIAFIRGDHRVLQRLLDMGLIPGTSIKVERVAPLNGPVEVCVRGSKVALGQDIASNVFVESPEKNEKAK